MREYPECPVHGIGGRLRSQTKIAYSIRYGKSSPKRPRQIFLCRYWLKSGERGEHRYRELIPRLSETAPTCSDCGQPTDTWQGEQVLENYWFTVKDIAKAPGASYRKAATQLRREGDRNQAKNPTRNFSNAPDEIAWLIEVLAPILHSELAPQTWPEGGILAVDAVKMNLLGTHKYKRILEDKNLATDEEDIERVPDAEKLTHDLGETLDPDDPDEKDVLEVYKKLFPTEAKMPGLQGGMPCWQILGAYGYTPLPDGSFPRDDQKGKPWLFRAYYRPNSLTWAHFFKQLGGTPAYILCDMEADIKVGVELAWPEVETRPKIIVCEYHIIEALKKRLVKEPSLWEAAERLFRTRGHRVNVVYQDHASNGEPGDIHRLWHFVEFRRLADQAELRGFRRLFATPTWRQIMAQVIAKDGKLRYSTGALEQALLDLASRKIAWRRTWFTNRGRTDCLLMLLQLNALELADADKFIAVIEHWIAHHGSLPRQPRSVDKEGAPRSLRRPLRNAELLAAGLPTKANFALWRAHRRQYLNEALQKYNYARDASLRQKINQARVRRRHRSDPQNQKRKAWYQKHALEQRHLARARQQRRKLADPQQFLVQSRRAGQTHRDHAKLVQSLATQLGCDKELAKQTLRAVDWNPQQALELLIPTKGGDTYDQPKIRTEARR